MKDKLSVTIIIVIIFAIITICIGAAITPWGRALWNKWFGTIQKVDDATNYETLKEVEDTCRAMMGSYTSDSLMYSQYDGTDNQDWADSAKVRANRTAATYNEYILKNMYVWKNNIPQDIKVELDYIN